MYLPDYIDEFIGRHTFQQIGAGSGIERTLNLPIAFEGRENDDARFRIFRPDDDQRIDSTQVRESQIHQRHIRPVVAILLDRLGATGGLRDQYHVRLTMDDVGNPLPEQRMVVHAEDANRQDKSGYPFIPRTSNYHKGVNPRGITNVESGKIINGGMGEWLKPAVLKSDPAHSGKFLKTKQILRPANDLRLFSVSPGFTHFYPV